MQGKKLKNIFIEGAISSSFIGDSIEQHSAKHNIGGHSIFLGQVRADLVDRQEVKAIEYTANIEMALEIMSTIREDIFNRYNLTCMHVYHSLGRVEAGKLCLFVFTSSAHRKAAMDACDEVVERIKAELPVWGKEILQDDGHRWKQNL